MPIVTWNKKSKNNGENTIPISKKPEQEIRQSHCIIVTSVLHIAKASDTDSGIYYCSMLNVKSSDIEFYVLRSKYFVFRHCGLLVSMTIIRLILLQIDIMTEFN